MNDIKLKPLTHENYSSNDPLPAVAGVGYSGVTTELLTVKPNRHSLAIFVPKFCGATNPKNATGANTRHNLTSYDGLIRPNKTPKGNKSSRLVAVVETRPPIAGVGIHTTELLGGHHHA